jgi:integrase
MMAVDDLWYLSKKDENGNRVPSKRHGRGKRWRCRWVDPESGQKREQLFEKKADAERHDANMRADISRGQYVDPRAGKITVAEYAELWREQQVHIDSTKDMVERAFRLHVRPLLGDLPMNAVRASHIRTWVKDRSAPGVLAASSVHLAYGYIATMFRAAVYDRIIGMSPCVGITLPTIDTEERYIPTPDEVHRVADALPSQYKAVVYVAAGCGLRSQEIFGLEHAHVDWLRREIHVRQQLKRSTARGAFIGAPKTKTSKRIVELPTVAQEALALHVERHPPTAQVLDDVTDPRQTIQRPVELLFPTSTGRPMYRSNWSKVWRVALRRAEVPPGWGLHSLRHYFATLLIHGGASVKTVQLALGHSKPSITLDTYTHEWPDVTERTRTLVDAALGTRPVRVGVAT